MKIGIMTYHRSHNYGAFLQSYALSNVLMEMGHQVEVINISSNKAKKTYIHQIYDSGLNELIDGIERYKMFEKNIEKLKLSGKVLYTDDVNTFAREVKNKYDIIISGSDEVWRIGIRSFPNPYWLCGDLGCLKVAYAVSARNDLSKFSEKELVRMKSYIDDYCYIGVRDDLTKSTLLSVGVESEIHKNCDPVFLYNFNQSKTEGRAILSKYYNVDTQKKTIAVMIGNKKLSSKIVSFLKEQYGSTYNFVALYFNHNKLNYYKKCTPFQWMNVIAASDFLISTYFHATCFAIKSDVPFFTIETRPGEDKNGKNYDLLSEAGLIDRLVGAQNLDLEQLKDMIDHDILKKFDFSDVCLRQKSKSNSFFAKIEELSFGK